MLDTKTQYEIAIAALLHDIGKFKQRAYGGDENELSQEVKKMEGQLLPNTKDGRYSHRHALWTYSSIIDDIAPRFRGNHFLELVNIEEIAGWAAKHHNATEDMSKIIEKADRISAGNDRIDKQDEYKRGDYLIKPLRSIFSSVNLDSKKDSLKSTYSYSLTSLSDDGAMFPNENKNVTVEEYRKLYDAFLDSLSRAFKDIHSFEHLLFKLKDLLYEYTWCIPSATNDYLNDISLYDHSITTMSIALALANDKENIEKIRVCAFCVSGIQSFIFQSKNASFKNAAKIFRGRSFIVSAFSTIIKKCICDSLGLIPFLDVLDAGGKMTMIIPSDIDQEELRKIQQEVEDFLLSKYYGTLSITLDYSVLIDLEELGNGKFMNFYKRIGTILNSKKFHKFESVLPSKDPVIEVELGKKVCSACGKHDSLNDGDFCDVCNEQLILGSNVAKKQFIIFSKLNGQCEVVPDYFISIVDESRQASFSIDNIVFSLSEDETFPVWRLNNYVPEDNDFVSISKKAVSEDGVGKPFLGYLKLDVDSLGKIIMEGFNKNEYSISRFSTISRSLHYFFNVYLYHMLEKEYPYSYTVLSGGDDVFLIMPWNQVLSLVLRIKDAFSKFCCHNPEIHFSVGVVVAGAKTPFAFVNHKANQALDMEAKEFDGKNAISYFGTTFSLNELDLFLQESDKLKSYIREDSSDTSKPITIGLLYRLYQYASSRLDCNATTVDRYSVYAKLHYDIARNLQTTKEEEKEIYLEATKFIMDKFNNYSSENDLKKLRVMLIHNLYSSRKTKEIEE